MSNVISKDVTCPKCNHTQGAHLYISINATNDPQFKYALLEGKILRYRCTNCGYEARYTYPLLYNDMTTATSRVSASASPLTLTR